MSYEGYVEFLCPDGHHWEVDSGVLSYGEDAEVNQCVVCPQCKKKAVWVCTVDQTNGADDELPETLPGWKHEIGFDDLWTTDHYGNKYAVKVMKYEPGGPTLRPDGTPVTRWKSVEDIGR